MHSPAWCTSQILSRQGKLDLRSSGNADAASLRYEKCGVSHLDTQRDISRSMIWQAGCLLSKVDTTLVLKVGSPDPSIIWELVRKANCQALFQTYWIINSGVWPSLLCFNKPSSESDACSSSRITDWRNSATSIRSFPWYLIRIQWMPLDI